MKNVIFALILLSCAFAHQPRIVEGPGIVEIKDPEISQAFYGELNGSNANFEIISDRPFSLYAGITVPAIEGEKKDKSVEVSRISDGREARLVFLNASESEWSPFYEEFAGDDYFQGPEYRLNASAGRYRIEVSSPDNKGKYALAVGEQEAFGPMDTLNALVMLPKLKSWFFNKSPFDALFTKIYLFAFAPIFALLALVALLVWAVKIFLKNAKKLPKKRAFKRGAS